MPGRQDHCGRAVNRVNARGKNLDRLRARDVRHSKFHFRALRLPYPVLLHQDDALRPSAFQLLQIIEQLVRIRGRLQEPLFNLARFDQRVFVPPAVAVVHDLFVRQHRAALRTPVHSALLPIRQPALQHAQEEPLVPAIIFRLAGGNLPPPVITESKAPQHSLESPRFPPAGRRRPSPSDVLR